MEFLCFMVKGKFLIPLILLLLITPISLGDVASDIDSTDKGQKARTGISAYVTRCSDFTTAKIDTLISYTQRLTHYAAGKIVPWTNNPYVNRCLKFTRETTLEEVIASIKSSFNIFLINQKFKEYAYLFVCNGLIILSAWYYLAPPCTVRTKAPRRNRKTSKAGLKEPRIFISKNSEKRKALSKEVQK
ncbi:hypothetical protein MKW94_010308 [Papaver nudicaule]|uniref:Uncharacterized protein n=1 Tax=Papaver nudicaule TaxID=74823 RepID=A0AA41VYY9_PAPNU|nr:hypothetical protein [Papaver nudicaule]